MPISLYETLFALDSTKVSADGDAVRTGLHGLIEKQGGEILVARPWDENGKLAYPINKQKKGYFYIVYYRLESTKQAALEADLRLYESLLRHMTAHIDPKWEETMLEIARNESGRFALKGMHDDAAPTGEGIVSNDPMVRGAMADAAAAAGGDRDRGDGPPPRGPRGPRGPRAELAEKPE
jgi:small subunit ribosomal protein S6